MRQHAPTFEALWPETIIGFVSVAFLFVGAIFTNFRLHYGCDNAEEDSDGEDYYASQDGVKRVHDSFAFTRSLRLAMIWIHSFAFS